MDLFKLTLQLTRSKCKMLVERSLKISLHVQTNGRLGRWSCIKMSLTYWLSSRFLSWGSKDLLEQKDIAFNTNVDKVHLIS